jgi:hypothetical protein
LNLNIPDICDKSNIIRHTCRYNPSFHSQQRYDWISLFNTQIKESDRKGDISDFSIGCLRLLFEFKQGGDIYYLAYIQHFIRRNVRDEDTGMWVLERTPTHEIVPINSILRHVHLVPFFDTKTSARNILMETKDIYSFDHYLLNHHCDRHTYFSLY